MLFCGAFCRALRRGVGKAFAAIWLQHRQLEVNFYKALDLASNVS